MFISQHIFTELWNQIKYRLTPTMITPPPFISPAAYARGPHPGTLPHPDALPLPGTLPHPGIPIPSPPGSSWTAGF